MTPKSLTITLGVEGGAYVTQHREDHVRPVVLFAGTLRQALEFIEAALTSGTQPGAEGGQ